MKKGKRCPKPGMNQLFWVAERLTHPFNRPFLYPTRMKFNDIKDAKLPLLPYLLSLLP